MRLVHASLGDKIPAASCYFYFLPPPKGAKAATGKEQFEVLQFNAVEARNCPIVGARYAEGYRGPERVQWNFWCRLLHFAAVRCRFEASAG
jgi:hypothetical protein